MQMPVLAPHHKLQETLEHTRQGIRQGLCDVQEQSPVGRLSLRPLSDLKPILLRDMEAGAVHLGKHLLVRVLDAPYKLRAVATNVEDAQGSACLLNIYHLIPDSTLVADASEFLPKGAVLAIKVSWVVL
jgi:hypothetical protein